MSESKTSDGCTIEEAASRLGIKPEGVHDLIAAGALKASGSGEDRRVSAESLLVYMASRISSLASRGLGPAPRSGLAVAGDIALPILVTLWYIAACAEVFSLRAGKPLVAWPVAIAGLAAILASCWWLARQATDFSSVRGVGTTLYGRRMTDHGRVGTQWLTFAGVPFLPVRSYIILEAGEPEQSWVGSVRTTNYRVRPLPAIYWPQALPILAATWIGSAALIALALHK